MRLHRNLRTAPRRSAAKRKLAKAAMLATGVVVGAGVLAPGSSQAASISFYDAAAAAQGVDATVANGSIPVGLTPEAAGPVAQVNQTSLPKSDAFASFPYPGDTMVGLAPTVGSLYGITVPDYPLMARSSISDTDAKTATFPGIALKAQSGPTVTEASGLVGTEATGGQSTARIAESADGGVTAKAYAAASVVGVAGGLSVTGAESEATVVADSSGHLTKSASTTISGISVPGLAITIPPSTPGRAAVPTPIPGAPPIGLEDLPTVPILLGGQTLPVPSLGIKDGVFYAELSILGGQKVAVPAQSVLDGLKAAGFTVTYQAVQETDTSITAPAITFTTVVPAPPDNPGFNGPTTLAYTFGRTSASVQMSTEEAAASGDQASVSGLPAGPGSDTIGTGSDAPASLHTDAASSAAAALGTAPTVNQSSAALTPAPGGSKRAPFRRTPVGANFPGSNVDAGWIYLLFVAIALSVFGGSTVLRLLGVRPS